MSYYKRYSHILFLLILILFLNGNVCAEQFTADEIIDKVKENQIEYENSKTQAEMIIIDKNGKAEEREIIMYEKEENDKINILMRFVSPKNVEGVTLLSTENGDKIYVYMPAYQKPRRIAGSSKKENFMGTDFSYEDLGMDYQSEDYQKELKEETETQYLIEVIPADEDISYSKFLLYVNKEQFYVEKVEFYNLEEQLTKTLEIKEVKFDSNNKITPIKIELTNIIDNHKTTMNIKEIEYDLELAGDFFSIRTMQKPRL
ncbi:MAG: outer membrane lipoprotein-sorting protein [Atribacterota bacterium]|nr:outer membrane lipoprotein-sorting protein [Atribacterota bacterium]MDD4895674.1 outer membrane lipoprotein-sorting protein [Atribacterota bacterium]MDD5637150.1 outer membrane lipoprotein-sorting protein [Atribacterota bacterium]